MQSLFEEVNQFYLPLKNYQETKTVKYFGVKILFHYQIRTCISGHSKFNKDWIFFFSKLLLQKIADYYVY